MTIIEDAVKKLEQARKGSEESRPALRPVGSIVEHDDMEGTSTNSIAHGSSVGIVKASTEKTSQMGVEVGEVASDKPTGGRLVVVDRTALRGAGLMPPEDDEGRLIDEFRHIKRPIIAHALGKRATKIEQGRLIMVGSALSGEGKTFTCVNLALSMAKERDLSIVLVDADVAKPHISRMFGLEDEPGLLDVLDDPDANDYKSLVLETDVPGLSVLPAGRVRGHATELLSSDRMEALLKAYRRDNIQRLVLFDSPPLLQTPEARVLGSLVGQIALVVRAGITPKHAVMDAIGMLDEHKAINLILNQSRQSSSGYGYGYGYGYGNRGGSGDRSA